MIKKYTLKEQRSIIIWQTFYNWWAFHKRILKNPLYKYFVSGKAKMRFFSKLFSINEFFFFTTWRLVKFIKYFKIYGLFLNLPAILSTTDKQMFKLFKSQIFRLHLLFFLFKNNINYIKSLSIKNGQSDETSIKAN